MNPSINGIPSLWEQEGTTGFGCPVCEAMETLVYRPITGPAKPCELIVWIELIFYLAGSKPPWAVNSCGQNGEDIRQVEVV